MLRKLPGFLTACILIITPLVANALGFGNIKLNSALNEPLDAEISLLSATVDEVSGLTVKMASREAFLRAGVDRPTFLNNINIEIKSRADDTFYIHLTSRQPIREPFLNFLLELNWYNGRILREYTVLLDPPGRVIKQPAVVETPEVTEPARIAREPEPEPAPAAEAATETETAPVPFPVATPEASAEAESAAPEPAAAPAEEESSLIVAEEAPAEEPAPVVEEEAALPEPAEAVVEPETIQPEPEVLPEPEPVAEDSLIAPEAATAAAPAAATAFSDDTELFPRIPLTEYREGGAAAGESAPQAQGELDYGITRKGDNLWTVAKKLQAGDESVSIYQIMMALLKSNPEAFTGGNVHRLKIGHVLRIEDPALLQAMTDEEARAAYRVQTEEWENYRQELAAAAESEQPIVAGELEAPAEAPEAETGGELTVAAPGGEELTAGEGVSESALISEVAALNEELHQLRADAEAMGGTDEALNRQIKELEAELADMQRAISVKDTELATVQQMASKANEEAAAAEAPQAEAPAAETEEPAAEAAPAPEAGVTETAEAPAEEVTEEVAGESVAEPETSEAGAPAETAEAPAAPAEPAAEPVPEPAPEPAPAPAPVVAVPPVPAPAPETGGFMAMVSGMLAAVTGMLGPMAGNSLLLFVGLPILLVLIILMVIVIRRRKQAQGGFQESILSGEPAAAPGSEPAEATDEESSFLSDFAVSGAGAIQAEDSEVDPLTEADVFMAYGRYEAAEERLTEALENDPSRKELKLKLLELYNATRNQSAFESAAEEFYASLGENANSDPMWEQVLTMGKELAPNNPLFTGDVVPSAAPAAEEPATEDPGVNLSDSQVMDIGLETGVFQAEELAPQPGETRAGEPDELDFNLDLGEESAGETAAAETPVEETSAAEEPLAADEGLDFNLDLGSGETEVAAEPPTAELELPEEEAGDAGLDFNLDLDSGEETPAAEAEAPAAESAETDLETELGGLDFELDTGEEPAAEAASEAEAGLDLNLDLDTGSEAGSESMPDLDFSLDTDSGSETLEVPAATEESAETDQTMVINLDESDEMPGENDDTSIDLTLDEMQSPDLDQNDETQAIDLGEDLTLDSLETDGEETAADLTLDIDEAADAADDLDLAAGGDEVGTKLDLARAYIDMGDPEGARSILDEVLDEGNDEQKQEAQQLIQQIA
ncbi:MAG TPA: hypothetical protein ENK40_01865 [Gammaproteobacteria bacterium]|nr:hypothetical protein [Gammaproteobacteria bacterium]